jgi:hypothetical protein
LHRKRPRKPREELNMVLIQVSNCPYLSPELSALAKRLLLLVQTFAKQNVHHPTNNRPRPLRKVILLY